MLTHKRHTQYSVCRHLTRQMMMRQHRSRPSYAGLRLRRNSMTTSSMLVKKFTFYCTLIDRRFLFRTVLYAHDKLTFYCTLIDRLFLFRTVMYARDKFTFYCTLIDMLFLFRTFLYARDKFTFYCTQIDRLFLFRTLFHHLLSTLKTGTSFCAVLYS